MHAANSSLNSVSRRTRSRWDAFYKTEYNKNKKKPDHDQDSAINNGEFVPNYEHQENQDFETKNYEFLTSDESDDERSDTSEDSDDEDSDDTSDDSYLKLKKLGKDKGSRRVGRPPKKKTKTSVDIEGRVVIDMLVESIWKEKGSSKKEGVRVRVRVRARARVQGNNNAVCESTLPLKFSLECGENCEKTEWEKEMDSLFDDLEMGLWESEAGFAHSSDVSSFSLTKSDADCVIISATNDTQAHRCKRGEHDGALDEQIGIVCKYCKALLLDIKDVLPEFHVESPKKWERKDSNQSEPFVTNRIHFPDSTCSSNLQSSLRAKGTVFDLIPQSDKELYPHQLDGFEFLWRNIAGDTNIKNLEELPPDGGRGCIISHAPGTGKTRLTIVFLQTFMKLYPQSRPLIIAPPGMLLTWEQEFKKWKVDIDFHNLNEKSLSDQETEIAAAFGGKTRRDFENLPDYIIYVRLVKLSTWSQGGGILGISYGLFEKLAGEQGKKRNTERETFKEILLELPGLIVMDEGHTPRNTHSLMWKAVTKIKTQRRVMLSGTPFQNNFDELYNTLCLVNPAFSQQVANPRRRRKINDDDAREEWSHLTSYFSKEHNAAAADDDRIKKIRSMIEPFVHIHKGGILQKTLPGIRDSLVILKPTDLQSKLLKKVPTRVGGKFLKKVYIASLISVHPSLVAEKHEFSHHKPQLKSLEADHNAGAKTKFLINLIQLSIRLDEKVLVFSQFIDPLIHVKNLLQSHFSWKEGREIIYMHGKQKVKQRQCSIKCFNEKQGSAKVLLASQRACGEGISLVGASRVVLLDVVWNPSVERQAICRAYRLGQEKIVYVYHLVTVMEVEKFVRQAEKERIWKLISTPAGEGEEEAAEVVVSDDSVVEAMVRNGSVGGGIEKIVHQPKESHFVNSFGFIDLK